MGLPDERGRADIFEHYLRGLKPRPSAHTRPVRRLALVPSGVGLPSSGLLFGFNGARVDQVLSMAISR